MSIIDKKKNHKIYIINAIIAAVLFLLQYNASFSLKIATANPMLMLSLCLAFSMFAGELSSFVFALVLGIVTDGAASTPVCFNAIIFTVISLALSLTVHYLFNTNIRSAAVLGILGSAVYYIIRFIICFPKQSLENAVGYSLRYLLPSVLYTAVLTIILYFAEKKIFGKFS